MSGEQVPARRRNTWQREAVRGALATTPGFVSAGALHVRLHNEGVAIGLATVYRCLNDLAESGEVDALTTAGGEVQYRACSAGHHHHLICRSCGKTVEIDAERVEQWAERVASEHGFSEVTHVIDIFGRCGDCAAN